MTNEKTDRGLSLWWALPAIFIWLFIGVAVQYEAIDATTREAIWPSESADETWVYPWDWIGATEFWLNWTKWSMIILITAGALHFATKRFGAAVVSAAVVGMAGAYLLLPLLPELPYLDRILNDAPWWKLGIAWVLLSVILGAITYGLHLIAIQLAKLINALIGSLVTWWKQYMDDKKAIHEATMDERRDAAEILARLPSADLTRVAMAIIMIAMFGSFFTTAMGFYDAVLDPHDPAWMKYSLSGLFSGVASLIITGAWHFVFRRLLIAQSGWGRILPVIFGGILIVPLTLGISTGFGLVGVGGTEAQRIDHRRYIDVLDVSAQLATTQREIQLSIGPNLEFLVDRFATAAQVELDGGSGCGAGKGDLWRFYATQQAQVASVLNITDGARKVHVGGNIGEELTSLRALIRDPGMPFEEAMGGIGGKFKEVREQIVAIQAASPLSVLSSLDTQLEAVKGDGFFAGWSACQSTADRKTKIRSEVAAIQANLVTVINDINDRTETLQDSILERIGAEERFHSLKAGYVPEFYPLDKFWAVIEYRDELPMYVLLQVLMDLSPFFLALLFAAFAPMAPKPKEPVNATEPDTITT